MEAFARQGFKGCIGLIDGSLLPLAQRHHHHGERYYDQKSRYLVNVQVVCDNQQKILYLFSGMAGSCSNLTCLRRSPMYAYCSSGGSNLMFLVDQYVIGDSRYRALPHMVSAFKRADSVSDKEDFDTTMVKCHVINEHCIGVLKSCWHSLKEIRVQLNDKKDNAWLNRWVLLCGKLHNYVLSQNDDWTEDDVEGPIVDNEDRDPEPELEPLGPGRVNQRVAVALGNRLLIRVMDEALKLHRRSGGYLFRP